MDSDASPLSSRCAAEVDALGRSNAGRSDAWPLPAEAAAFMHALALARGAKRSLELGTSYGYSALWLAAAMQRTGGRLITIDREQRKLDLAAQSFERAGVSDCINIHCGEIAATIDTLPGPFDFVLIDADKPGSLGYLRGLRQKLAPGAVVLTDNLLHPEGTDWSEFLTYARGESGLYSTLVRIGNGMELTVVLPDPTGRK